MVLVRAGVRASAALVWSADGQTLFWTDGAAHAILTLTMVDPGCWPPRIGAPLPLPRPDSGAGDAARLAGATVDSAGRYWVAVDGGGSVQCLTPTGRQLLELPLLARCPTAVAFGGPDLRTLFVVTSRQHRPAAELEAFPDSGAVFARRLATPGLPPPRYWD